MERVKKALQISLDKHKNLWKDRSFVGSVIVGTIALLLAFVVNYYAGHFAQKSISNSVTDIILDNIPVWNVTFIFIKGAVMFWVFIAIMFIIEPKRLPFSLKALALFTVTRSVFIILTHLAPPEGQLVLPAENMIDIFTFGGDLFFSAHTGGPFLMMLIFWDHKYIRYFCLAVSLVFAAVVLLGHLHYSIDVFAAFFITYSIYHIAVYFFKRDFALIAKYDNIKIA